MLFYKLSNDQPIQFNHVVPTLSTGRYLALAFLTILFWILTHPYYGIWHDATLYTVQALNILYPEIYQEDVFFKYGSQASFTIFPFINALVIQKIGVDNSAFLLTVIGLSLFFAGTLTLTRHFITSEQTVLFLILFTTLPVYLNPVLTIFEVFVTSRNISAGLSLLFLSFVLKKRFLVASILLIVALLLHPLMSLGASVIALFLQRSKVIFSVILFCLVSVILCLVFSIPLINLLTQTIGIEWRELIVQRSPFIFIEKWGEYDLNLLLLEICIILTAKSYCTDKLKQTFNAVLIATALGLFISLVASWFSNTLLIQLQTWRILLFTHVFAVIAFTWIISTTWNNDNGKIVVLLYFSVFLSLDSIGALPALVIYFYWLFSLNHQYTPPPIIIKGAYAILLQCAFWYVLSTELADPTTTSNSPTFTFASNLKFLLLNKPFYITILLIALLFFSKYRHKRAPVFLSITILLLSPLALYYFDQRYRNTTWDSGDSEPYTSLREEIPENATVYCAQGVETCWFLLRRKQYMSPKQSAGIVFSRETALETKRRADLLFRAGFEDGVFQRAWNNTNIQDLPTPTLAAFNALCHDPMLDYLILASQSIPKTPDKVVDTANKKINIHYCSPISTE
ncbi:MAG: hypothetical protein ABW152_16020 [Candidatus Thiodiazotropha endolucinida]